MKKLLLVFAFSFLLSSLTFSQTIENKSSLSIEQIMQGEKFVGHWVNNPFWGEDNQTIYFDWNPNDDTLSALYKVVTAGAQPQKVSVDELKNMPSSSGDYNIARTMKAYTKNGDIFLLNLKTGSKQQITNTSQYESGAEFSGDEKSIIYSAANNLFSWSIEKGHTTQLTNFISGSKKAEPTLSEYQQWLENDQYSWFEILGYRKKTKDLQEKQNKLIEAKRPLEIYLNKNSLSGTSISPNQKFVVYRVANNPENTSTEVPDYVTSSGFAEMLRARSKVGAPQATYESWVYDIENDTTFQIDIEQLEGIKDKPAFLKDYHKGDTPWEDQYEKPRSVIMHGPVFSKSSKAVVEFKSLDNKDRWIMSLDLPTGKLKLLDRQHDDAWVGGPGIHGWNGQMGNIGWMRDGQRIFFQSEATGYSHLYTLNVETGKKKALTKGEFEIINAWLSNDESTFYLVSNKDNVHENHLFSMPANGGKMIKITSMPGGHEPVLSPNESQIAFRYSTSTTPWELYVMPNKAQAKARKLTKSTTSAYDKYPWRTPEIVYFDADDGAKVPAKLYQPANPVQGGGAVIFVHGAGYLQNVHKWWGYYYREQMFHNILADNGITVLDIDYRASDGYGRDWRTAIYRFMGGKDLDDQVDGAKFLKEKHGVDPDKIGIYGGSYGGFITLMAMFTKPGVFKSGAAIRSVGDWAHYNHAYTSNILNTPVEDSLAYYKSSPVYHADGLEGHLLILHGMLDTNVHYQDMVRIAQRLIELGKENWELSVFPLEGHGFVEPSSWTDEYKRIFKLFMETLK